jgi:hypothetical protein
MDSPDRRRLLRHTTPRRCSQGRLLRRHSTEVADSYPRHRCNPPGCHWPGLRTPDHPRAAGSPHLALPIVRPLRRRLACDVDAPIGARHGASNGAYGHVIGEGTLLAHAVTIVAMTTDVVNNVDVKEAPERLHHLFILDLLQAPIVTAPSSETAPIPRSSRQTSSFDSASDELRTTLGR